MDAPSPLGGGTNPNIFLAPIFEFFYISTVYIKKTKEIGVGKSKIGPPGGTWCAWSRKSKKMTFFAIFGKFQKRVIYVGIGNLEANFHDVNFKNGNFSGKSVFFSDFRKPQFTEITILQKVSPHIFLLLLRFLRFFNGTGLNQILLKFR